MLRSFDCLGSNRKPHLRGLHRSALARAASVSCLAAWLIAAGPPLAVAQQTSPQTPPAAAASNTPLDAAVQREVAETLAKALTDKYAYADIGAKMAQVIRRKLEVQAYDKITSNEKFALTLQADARSVANDLHLSVSFNPQGGMQMSGPPPADMMARMRAQNGAISRLLILPGNIGYMEVNGAPPLEAAKEAVAVAFAFVHNTAALIIDVRGNGGGTEETVAWYMSYLHEGPPSLVNVIQTRDGSQERTYTTNVGALSYGTQKPVFCLTSNRTFSGGEELAYDLKVYKRALTVGEATGGGAHPTDQVVLARGFVASIPYGYADHPVTHSNWEGVGVQPDVSVPAEQALIEAQKLAIQKLMAEATDPKARTGLEALARDLVVQSKSQSVTLPNRLKAARSAGSYAMGGGGNLVIQKKGGVLYLQSPPSASPYRLIPLGADRYRVAGMPEDFTLAFSERQGKIQLVANLGYPWDNPLPTVAEKK